MMFADVAAVAAKEWKERRRPQTAAGRLKTLILPVGTGLAVAAGPRSGGLVLVLVLTAFLSANALVANVVDAMAGERERHTLATLLSTPLGDTAILAGKLAVAAARMVTMMGPTFAVGMAVLALTGRVGAMSAAKLWGLAAVVLAVLVLGPGWPPSRPCGRRAFARRSSGPTSLSWRRPWRPAWPPIWAAHTSARSFTTCWPQAIRSPCWRGLGSPSTWWWGSWLSGPSGATACSRPEPMLIRINPSSTLPVFEQIAAGARRAIADGELGAGEQLPAARALAESLGVNMHTALRAYQLLRDEGLVELRRGRGVTITGNQPAAQARLVEAIAAVVGQARALGLAKDEAAELVREAMA